jgi:hypothetical protein
VEFEIYADAQPSAATARRLTPALRSASRLSTPRPARDAFSTLPGFELVAQHDGRVPAWSLPGLPARYRGALDLDFKQEHARTSPRDRHRRAARRRLGRPH